MSEETREERINRLKKNTYKMTIKFLFIFSIPAFLGVIIGKYVDYQFGIEPYGSLGVLVLFYVLSWVIVFMLNKRLKIFISENAPEEDTKEIVKEASGSKKDKTKTKPKKKKIKKKKK